MLYEIQKYITHNGFNTMNNEAFHRRYSLVSGFRSQRGDIFILNNCVVKDDYVEGYSRFIRKTVEFDISQVRPVLSKHTRGNFVCDSKAEAKDYLILPSSDNESPMNKYRLDEYLRKCNIMGYINNSDPIGEFGILTASRRRIVDCPKFIINTINDRCSCFFDNNDHWVYPIGMYGVDADRIIHNIPKNVLLAIFNSKLFSVHRLAYMNEHKEMRNASYNSILSFPLPTIINQDLQDIIDRIVLSLTDIYKGTKYREPLSQKYLQYTREVLDMCIYELYFPEMMEAEDIDVKNELMQAPFMSSCDFMNAKDIYNWLMKPENRVRQKIMLLDSRSPLLSKIHNYYFHG